MKRITTILVSCLLVLAIGASCESTVRGDTSRVIGEIVSVFPRNPKIKRPRYRKVVRRWRNVAPDATPDTSPQPIPQPNPIHPGLIATFQFFASIGGLLAFNTAIRGESGR